MVKDNLWVEPSRVCLENPLPSITTAQGWVMWSAIFSVWLICCECMDTCIQGRSNAVMHRWYSVLGQWCNIKHGALPRDVAPITREAIAKFFTVRDTAEIPSPKESHYFLTGIIQLAKRKRPNRLGLTRTPRALQITARDYMMSPIVGLQNALLVEKHEMRLTDSADRFARCACPRHRHR